MADRHAEAQPNEERHELTSRQADFFVIGWTSFLAASLGTMLLFAWIDPEALAEIAEPPLPLDRMGGYALGFFFLWMLCLLSAGLCVYLIRTRTGHKRTSSDRS